MCLQTVEVQGGGVTDCTQLGMLVDYSSGPADDKFSLMCRRQAPDDCELNFLLQDTDEIFGDVFQYRMGRKGKATVVRLTVPIFAAPGPKDNLVLMSEKGHMFPVESTKKGLNVCFLYRNRIQTKFNLFLILNLYRNYKCNKLMYSKDCKMRRVLRHNVKKVSKHWSVIISAIVHAKDVAFLTGLQKNKKDTFDNRDSKCLMISIFL